MSAAAGESEFSTKLVTLLSQLVAEAVLLRGGASARTDLRHVPNLLGGFHVAVLSLGHGVRTLTLSTNALRALESDAAALHAHLAALVRDELVDPLLPVPTSATSATSATDKLSTASASTTHSSAPLSVAVSDAAGPPSDLEPDFGAARPGFVHDPLLIPRVAQPPLFGSDGMLVGPDSFGPAARNRRPPGVMPGARFDPIGPQFGGGAGLGGIGGAAPQQLPHNGGGGRRRLPPGEEPPGFEDEHRYNPYNDMFM